MHERNVDGQNIQGWKYIELALKQLVADSTLPGRDGTIALLGSVETTVLSTNDAGSAYYFAASANSYTLSFYNGNTTISNFFDDLRQGITRPSVIALAGSDATNDISPLEAQAITENTDLMQQYINDGGSVMSHTGGAVYGWLFNATGVVDADGCQSNGAQITMDGMAVFGELTNNDINGNAGPCHNHFVPPFPGFQTFAFDGLGRSFIIMSRGSIDEVPNIRLNCSASTLLAGDWSLTLDDHFNVSFFVDAGVSGDAFEMILQNALNNDANFINAGCSATFPGALQIACPSTLFDRFGDISFRNNTIVCFEDSCDPFEGFGMNGLACPEPPCPMCDGEPVNHVCDQRQNLYMSECELNRLSCLFPADPLELTPCPPTPMPTMTPTVAPPSPLPTQAPATPLPTSAPTPEHTAAPTPTSTNVPTPEATVEPTALPTNSPTPEPTSVPTPEQTSAPTPEPTSVPTPVLTGAPTPQPTSVPTPGPTSVPTPVLTNVPTPEPTSVPTPEPTIVPTPEPTSAPTPEPTGAPTPAPTVVPTPTPTDVPTPAPSSVPTPEPTLAPTPTPTELPTPFPTLIPVPVPTDAPSPMPTAIPVPTPTDMPTLVPTPMSTPLVTGMPTTSPISTSPAPEDAGELGPGDTSSSGSTSSQVLSNGAIAAIVVGGVAAVGAGVAVYYKVAA